MIQFLLSKGFFTIKGFERSVYCNEHKKDENKNIKINKFSQVKLFRSSMIVCFDLFKQK